MSSGKPRTAQQGIHSIDHFTLEVPDLELAQTFFDAFGLSVEKREHELNLYASGSRHRWGRLIKGEHKRLAYLAFNCHTGALEALRGQVQASGAMLAARHETGSEEGFWCRDPDGNLLQVRVGPKTTPDAKIPAETMRAEAGERAVFGRSSYGKIHPRRLSHVLMFTSDINRALDFYTGALGLRLSDRAGDIVAFLHAPHGSDHHLVAFAQAHSKGWHHSSWDVPGIEQVGRGASQMAAAGYKNGWGTGRHVLGSNYFHYVQDPWGSFAEYSADIDYVPAGGAWDGGDWPAEDSFYLWGPDIPDYFLANSEANRN